MTAVITDADLGWLCDLARRWQQNPLGLGRARDLAAVLDVIIARRAKGGDVLAAGVRGDSVPELHAAALLKAAELWGPEAELAVEETDTVFTCSSGPDKFHAQVTVRCLNYAEVSR